MRKAKRERTITFRVTQERYEQIELAALEAGKTPTDWSREVCEEKAISMDRVMTRGERMVFEELACVRFLMGNAFGLMAIKELSQDTWDKVRKESAEKAEEHVKILLDRYESRWFFGGREVGMIEESTAEA